jgi:hypothetical protein
VDDVGERGDERDRGVAGPGGSGRGAREKERAMG